MNQTNQLQGEAQQYDLWFKVKKRIRKLGKKKLTALVRKITAIPYTVNDIVKWKTILKFRIKH